MGEYIGDDNRYQDTTDIMPRRSVAQHPAVLLALLTAIAGLLYLSYRSSIGSGDETATDADQAIESDSVPDEAVDPESDGSLSETEAADEAESGDDDGAADGADQSDGGDADSEAVLPVDLGGPVDPPPVPGTGPFVAATLNLDAAPGNGLMTVSGRVPDQATADAVLQAAELSYAPFVESRLEVDESLDPAEWLAVAPQVIGLLPSVTDGTIMVADQQIQVSARSPNPQYLENLQGALALFGQGMPVELVETRITDLAPPLFAVEAEDGAVTLNGYVPSEEVIALLAGGAEAAYGAEQVTNNLTVDDTTYPSFWMQTMPGVFQLFRIFPSYDFTVEDGQFSGRIQGGVNFAADSTQITAEAAQALDIGVAVLARDPSIGMLVTGHTDSLGPDEYNQNLSAARAQSVVDYFLAAGIDPARLVAQGAGEAQPIDDNSTPEGRARNRRVEFAFGSASSLGGG